MVFVPIDSNLLDLVTGVLLNICKYIDVTTKFDVPDNDGPIYKSIVIM